MGAKPIPDGEYIYVVDMERGVQYYNRSGQRYPHPNLVSGENILCAGEIVMKGNKVTSLNNISGHYQPPSESLHIAKMILESKGMLDKNAQISSWGP